MGEAEGREVNVWTLRQPIRVTLQKLEENFAAPDDQNVIAELKRILLLRIADLEFVGAAVEKGNAEEAVHQDAVRLRFTEDHPEAA